MKAVVPRLTPIVSLAFNLIRDVLAVSALIYFLSPQIVLAQTALAPETAHSEASASETVPPENAEQESKPPPKFIKETVVEISAHGDERITAMVVWNTGSETYPVDQLALPFQFAWVSAPNKATGFMVLPLGTASLPAEKKWIELKGGNGLNFENIYVSIRNTANGGIPAVDANYGDVNGSDPVRPVRPYRRHPQAPEGWTFIGNWDVTSFEWKSAYWVHADSVVSSGPRRRVVEPPSALVSQEIVCDFPVRLRVGSSVQYPEVQDGELIRPGTKVKIVELRFDVNATSNGVWAKVAIEDEKETPKSAND